MNRGSNVAKVRLFFIAALFLETGAASFGVEKRFNCRCLLRDQIPPLASPYPPNLDKTVAFNLLNARPQTAAAISEKIKTKFLKLREWMSVFRHSLPLPTTTTTMDPIKLLHSEGVVDSTFFRLGRQILGKYFQRLRDELNVLEKFECVCEGKLLDVFKANSFINIDIAHD